MNENPAYKSALPTLIGLSYVGTSDQCGKAGFVCRIFVHYHFSCSCLFP